MREAPRPTVRALLVTPDAELLLMQFRAVDGEGTLWVTPGGGIDPGEDDESALRRELAEECGLTTFDPGPVVWIRENDCSVRGRRMWEREWIHWVPVERFEPRPVSLQPGLEADHFLSFRWWTLAELEGSTERFAPRTLVARFRSLLAVGLPAEPIVVGP